MAGHLLLKTIDNYSIVKLWYDFLRNIHPDDMKPFERYDIAGNHVKRGELKDEMLVFQKLTDRYDPDDILVLSIYETGCLTTGRLFSGLNVMHEGETLTGGIIEIHQKKNLTLEMYYVL